MTRPQVMDLTAACQCFPELIEPQVPRDNILSTLEMILGGETQVVTVEGPPGIGKTTLLAQFVRAHPHRALSLFARPVSRWTYDPELLRFDLCNQLQWLLKGEELSTPETATDAFLRVRLSELQRRARRERQNYFFVVDGLEDIPQEEHQVRDLILGLLPLGLSGFRFVLSASGEKTLSAALNGVPSKSYPLSGFIFEETARYFADLNVGPEELREVHRMCRESPGSLASVRRILRSGTDIRQFLDEAPSKVPNLFEIEWRAVDQSNTSLMLVLGLLSHDRGHHTVDWLALVLGLPVYEVERLVKGLGFLSIDPTTKDVSFVSETVRKYSATRLQDLKRVVSDMVIDYLLRDPQSDSAFANLPKYLEEAGRHEELLKYLSPANFARMLACTSSLSVVQGQAEMGIEAAWRLRRDGDLLRFSIQRASLAELDRIQVWRPEIEARIALGDHKGALALAQSTVTHVDRLHLLAVVAKARHQSELGIEPELVEQIRLLYGQVNHGIDRNRAVEIASALIYSAPDLAIQLVEKGANTIDEDENSLDLAFAALSVAALIDDKQNMLSVGPVEMINQRIKDPAIRKFSSEVALLLGKYSAAEVLAEVEKVDGTGNRLYLLSEWAATNRRRADAADVAEYGLLLAIRTTAYAPNAAVLRKLASPLPFLKDYGRARQLIAQFDGQRTAVEQIGPTEEYVRLQLLLARAESEFNRESARNRFVDIYLYVANLDDISIRASLLGRLVAGLVDSDPTMSMDSVEGIHGLALDDLRGCVSELLASTAEQTHAVRDIVRVLARNKMDMAVEMATSLNIEYRRDEALLEAIRYASRVSPDAFDVRAVQSALARIAAPAVRDEALREIVNSLSSAADCVAVAAKKVTPFVGAIRHILSAAERCRAYCLTYDLLSRASGPDYGSQMDALLDSLDNSWRSLEEGWLGISVGFEIAKLMSKSAPEVAKLYLSRAERMRADVQFDDRKMTSSYIAAIRLAVRALGGLLPGGHEGADDVERLSRLITFLPSSGQQAVIWSDLALQYSANGRTDECKRIVSEHLRPLLVALDRSNEAYRIAVVVSVAPALYCGHRNSAFEFLSSLPTGDRDHAYWRICQYLLRKKHPDDSFDAPDDHVYEVTHGDVLDILEIVQKMDSDSAAYWITQSIAQSVEPRHQHSHKFTQQNKLELASRLREIAEKNLPNVRHIKHDGYKIAWLAQAARLGQAKPQEWQELVLRAQQIPNQADRVLVLCIVAAALPSKDVERRRKLFGEAKDSIRTIPSVLDRIERYQVLASMSADSEPALCKEALDLAMKASIGNDGPEIHSACRKVIDLAYRIDPELASSLAALADDDPARLEAKEEMRDRVSMLNVRKEMLGESNQRTDTSRHAPEEYGKAAWMLLGALNSGRVDAIHVEQTRHFSRLASQMPLTDSFPILAWVIENAVRRLARTSQAAVQLRPMFEARDCPKAGKVMRSRSPAWR